MLVTVQLITRKGAKQYMAVKRKNKKEKESLKDKKSSRKPKEKETKKNKRGSLRERAKEQMKESKKKGFTAMREAKKEYSSNNRWMNFWVAKGETKPIIPLTEDLKTVRTHNVKQMTPTGKEYYAEFLCTADEDCHLCEEAKAGNKAIGNPRTTGITLLVDVEGYEKDGQEVPFVIRPMTVNPTLSSVLEHRDNKEGLYLTAFDMTKLQTGHSLDVIRDGEDDEIWRFDSVEDLIDYIREENEQTAEMLEKALEEYGDLDSWLTEEIIPAFLDPEQAKIADTSKDDDDEDEGGSYKFSRGRRGKGSKEDKKKQRRSRLR